MGLGKFFSRFKRPERRREARLPLVSRGRCKNFVRGQSEIPAFDVYVLDISPSGCQIVSEKALPAASLTSLGIPENGPGCRLAFVAYCQSLGKIYRAGLAFVPQSP